MRVIGLTVTLLTLSAIVVQSAPPMPDIAIVAPPDGFFAEPGTYPVKHDSDYLFFAVRTVVTDRNSKNSFEEA